MKTGDESYEDNLATAVINKVGLVANILSDQVLFLTLSNKEKLLEFVHHSLKLFVII